MGENKSMNFKCYLALLLLNACATSQTEATPKTLDPGKNAHNNSQNPAEISDNYEIVKPQDQKAVSDWIRNRKEDVIKAFCLFSTGGWSDRGQHCVIDIKGRHLVLSKEYGSQSEFKESMLPKEKYAKISGIQSKIEKLSSIREAAMDHLRYEFVLFEKSGKDVKVIKRLIIDHPEPQRVSEEYGKAIEDYLKLFEKPKRK